MQIFLIGFMGSGKTHWGRLLAAETGQPYFDLDEVIVAAEKMSVERLFQQNGEEYFRNQERATLEALALANPDAIISTGGGTPCFFNNIDFMRSHGRVIWLNTSIDILVARLLKQKHSRPLIKNVSDEDLKAFIIKKLQDRKMYYQQAHITLQEETITTQSLLKSLQDA